MVKDEAARVALSAISKWFDENKDYGMYVYRGWMMQPDQYFRALYGINLPTRDPCKSTYQATGNRLLSEAHGSKDPIKDHPRNYRHLG